MIVLRSFLLLIAVVNLTAVVNAQKKPKYFEGELEYRVEYISKSDLFDSEFLKNEFGTKMLLIFKEGSYCRKYFSSSGKLLSERYLDLKNGKVYGKSADSDTVYWYDVRKEDTKFDIKILEDSVINGTSCKRILLETEAYDGINKKQVLLKSIYAYSQKLPVNPKWYNNFKEVGMNKIMSHAKGLMLESHEDRLYFDAVNRLDNIKRRKVKRTELKFKIADKALLKEL